MPQKAPVQLDAFWSPTPKTGWSLDLPARSTSRQTDLSSASATHKEELVSETINRVISLLKKDSPDVLPQITEELDAMASWGVVLWQSAADRCGDLLSAAVGHRNKAHFFPDVLEKLEKLGLPLGLSEEHSNEEQLFYWCAAGSSAWSYALNRALKTAPGISRQLALSFCEALADHPGGEVPSASSPHQSRIEVLWNAAPAALQEYISAQEAAPKTKQILIKSWAEILKCTLFSSPQMTSACAILLDPGKLGRSDVVEQFVRSVAGNISPERCQQLFRFLSDHPTCAQLWSSNLSVPSKVQNFRRTFVGEKRYIGRSWTNHNGSLSIRGGLLTHAIVEGNSKLVRTLAFDDASRQALVQTVLADPNALLALLLDKKDTGIDERHLLAWGGDTVRSWRDEKGCCLAHYAAGSAPTFTAADRILAQMINLVPEWRSVIRSDGVPLISLFKDQEAQSRASKRELKDVTASTMKEKSKTPVRRRM